MVVSEHAHDPSRPSSLLQPTRYTVDSCTKNWLLLTSRRLASNFFSYAPSDLSMITPICLRSVKGIAGEDAMDLSECVLLPPDQSNEGIDLALLYNIASKYKVGFNRSLCMVNAQREVRVLSAPCVNPQVIYSAVREYLLNCALIASLKKERTFPVGSEKIGFSLILRLDCLSDDQRRLRAESRVLQKRICSLTSNTNVSTGKQNTKERECVAPPQFLLIQSKDKFVFMLQTREASELDVVASFTKTAAVTILFNNTASWKTFSIAISALSPDHAFWDDVKSVVVRRTLFLFLYKRESCFGYWKHVAIGSTLDHLQSVEMEQVTGCSRFSMSVQHILSTLDRERRFFTTAMKDDSRLNESQQQEESRSCDHDSAQNEAKNVASAGSLEACRSTTADIGEAQFTATTEQDECHGDCVLNSLRPLASGHCHSGVHSQTGKAASAGDAGAATSMGTTAKKMKLRPTARMEQDLNQTNLTALACDHSHGGEQNETGKVNSSGDAMATISTGAKAKKMQPSLDKRQLLKRAGNEGKHMNESQQKDSVEEPRHNGMPRSSGHSSNEKLNEIGKGTSTGGKKIPTDSSAEGAQKEHHSETKSSSTDATHVQSYSRPFRQHRSFSESGVDQEPIAVRRGILKNSNSRRTMSESSDDIAYGSSLDSEAASSSGSLESIRPKKTVSFNDHIFQMIFRVNSSILGRRRKNQKKAANKKRAAARAALRHSEQADTSGASSGSEASLEDLTGAPNANLPQAKFSDTVTA